MKYLPFNLIPLLLILGVGTAGADGPAQDYIGVRLLLAQGYSLDEAVSTARRRYSGKVLSAETIRKDGRPIHRIRIIEDGRVRGLRIDGNTGQPLPRGQNRSGARAKPRAKPRLRR